MIRRGSRLTIGVAVVAALVLPRTLAARQVATRTAGRVVVDTLWSQSLGTRKSVVIYLPPSYATAAGRRFPVAYYLHGMFGTETDWTKHGALNVVADSLAAAGRPEMIVVMPDGDDSYYSTWNTLLTIDVCKQTAPKSEPAESYCVPWSHYDDYIARDVVQFVDKNYRTQPTREHRAIAGLSMGGYGAISLALQYPETFSAAASHSGILSPRYAGPTPFVAPPTYATSGAALEKLWKNWWRYFSPIFGRDPSGWWSRDPARRLQLLVGQRGKAAVPALFADVGTEDAFMNESRAFRWEVEQLGIPFSYHEWPGDHGWTFWRAHVGESLSFLADHIAK